MWEIFEHHSIDKAIAKLPHEVLKRYEKWKDVARYSGPSGIALIKGFHDEKLKGKWTGYRSSRLNDKYRVIYKVNGKKFYVNVQSISPHDYRRK